MEQVRLPELETIRRFSVAVRSEHAPAEQVLEALQMDLERVKSKLGRRAPASPSPARNAPKRAGSRSTSSKSTRSR